MQGLDRDDGQAAEKRDAQKDVHRRLDPLDLWPVVRQAPDDDRADPAQEAEVLDPVKRGEKKIGATDHDAAAMIPPPRTRLPE